MTGRREVDYVAVLEGVRKLLLAPRIQEVMMDFEKGTWNAFNSVFGDLKIKLVGCSFHFAQAVVKRVGKYHLKGEYFSNSVIFEQINSLLALCYLPWEEIEGAFDELERTNRPHPEKIAQLFAYMKRTWMTGGIWTPSAWSVFDMLTRTNNATEGTHNKWRQSSATMKNTIYKLASIMFNKVRNLDLTEKLVAHGKESQQKSKTQQIKDTALADVWDEYKARKESANPILPAALLQRAKEITRDHIPYIPDDNYVWDSDESSVED